MSLESASGKSRYLLRSEDVFRMAKCLMNLESEFNSNMNCSSTIKTNDTPTGNLVVRTRARNSKLENRMMVPSALLWVCLNVVSNTSAMSDTDACLAKKPSMMASKASVTS